MPIYSKIVYITTQESKVNDYMSHASSHRLLHCKKDCKIFYIVHSTKYDNIALYWYCKVSLQTQRIAK